MKTKTGIIVVMMLSIFTACNKTSEDISPSVEGTYTGTLIKSTGLKSIALDGDVNVDVNLMDSITLEIHCYGGELDTTMMLNYYEENDSTFLCFSNEQFQGMFGYAFGSTHMMGGGMMGNNDDDEWMNHMQNENYTSNEHFGGFNMMDHSFDYTFNRSEDDSIAHFHFHGLKQ
ncbi:MAG: hypothetical protein ACERKD_06485 [Prolixibacteraceae bacterium]